MKMVISHLGAKYFKCSHEADFSHFAIQIQTIFKQTSSKYQSKTPFKASLSISPCNLPKNPYSGQVKVYFSPDEK